MFFNIQYSFCLSNADDTNCLISFRTDFYNTLTGCLHLFSGVEHPVFNQYPEQTEFPDPVRCSQNQVQGSQEGVGGGVFFLFRTLLFGLWLNFDLF